MLRAKDQRTRPLSLGLLAGTLALGVAAAPALDLEWRSSDHDRIAKGVGDYFEALTEKKDVSETWQELADAIEKVEKRHENVLSYVEDWEQVFKLELLSTYRERPRKGKIATETFNAGDRPIEVALHFPDSYTTKDVFPLVLIACEPGKTPEATLEEHWAAPEARAAAILCAVAMPGNEELLGKFEGDSGDFGGVRILMAAYGLTKQSYAVDMDRVFAAGRGPAVAAAMTTAAAYPQLFAGAIAQGGGADVSPTNFGTIPTLWQAAGEAGTQFEAAAKEAGLENVTVGASPDAVEVASWLGDKQRDPYPLQFTFSPVHERALSAGWVTLVGASDAAGSKLVAKTDRESNTITLDAENVVSANLYLNDAIVDLSKPVKVVLNGRMEEVQLARNQKVMVELMYYQGDWGRVFTVTESFDFGE